MNTRPLICLCCLLIPCLAPAAASEARRSTPRELRCDYLPAPLGIETQAPRFSRQVANPDGVRGRKQTARHILVASERSILDHDQGDLWDSGKVASGQFVLVPYAGRKLLSNQTCHWKVRIDDESGLSTRKLLLAGGS
jgi:alpha-L-rhamnosidase